MRNINEIIDDLKPELAHSERGMQVLAELSTYVVEVLAQIERDQQELIEILDSMPEHADQQRLIAWLQKVVESAGKCLASWRTTDKRGLK